MAWMGVPKASLELAGPISDCSLSSIAKRTYCSKCGSSLTLQYDCYPEKTHVAAATMVKSELEAEARRAYLREELSCLVQDSGRWSREV